MTDADLDIELGLEDAFRAWRAEQEARDDEWAFDEAQRRAVFEAQLTQAIEDEHDLLVRPVYREYLKTRTWALRAAWVKRWGFCGRCRRASEHLHAHHLTYERLGHERWSDLIALCRRCHEAIHQRTM